jgi:hypothetical protein
LGGVKRKVLPAKDGLRFHCENDEFGALAQRIDHVHAHQAVRTEAQPRELEARVVGAAGTQFDPVQSIGLARLP